MQDHQEFKVIFSYIISLGPAWAAWCPVSKKKKLYDDGNSNEDDDDEEEKKKKEKQQQQLPRQTDVSSNQQQFRITIINGHVMYTWL